MDYTFRQLNSKDIFPISKIITKIGIKEFKEVFSSPEIKKLISGGEKDAATLGTLILFDLAGVIVSNLGNCEKDIYSFLSSVSGLKVSEIETMSMSDFAEMVVELIQKDEFKDFFKVVSKLLH